MVYEKTKVLVIKNSEYRLIITWVTEALFYFHKTCIIQGKYILVYIAQIITKQVTILLKEL